MKFVSIMNQKGGVGKSFLAAEIYYELSARGYKVGYSDQDAQGRRVHDPKPIEDGDDIVIIDTPGHLDKEFVSMAKDMDVIIIPTMADDEGQKGPLLESYFYAIENPDAVIGIVVSCFEDKETMSKAYVEEIKEADLPLWGTIRKCAEFKKAHANGRCLRDYEPKKKEPIADITAIVEKVEEACGFEKRETPKSLAAIERKANSERAKESFKKKVQSGKMAELRRQAEKLRKAVKGE